MKQNFLGGRGGRLAGSLLLTGLVLSQLPLGALLLSPARGQGASTYTDGTTDDSGSFLGIKGFSNRDVATAGVVGLAIFGIVTAVKGGAGAGDSAGGAAPSGAPAGTPGALPDPLVAGDEKQPIWDVLHADSGMRFAQFTAAAAANEVKETPLRDMQNAPYTCFAPTDAAVSALPAAEGAQLADSVANKTANQKLLLRHVVFGRYGVRDLEKLDAGFPLATAAGDTLTVSKNPDGTVDVNGVPVLREDIRASNGVSHPIASVLK